MKWPALLMSLFTIIICTFCYSQYDFVNHTGDEVYKLVFQAALSGAFTFCGLFITITNQERQQRKLEKQKLCPCLILEQNGVASAKQIAKQINTSDVVWGVDAQQNSASVRCLKVKVINIKGDSWALNCRINGTIISPALKSNKESIIQIILYSEAEDIELPIEFCDIYGTEYIQKITYSCSNGWYLFTSHQPQKSSFS